MRIGILTYHCVPNFGAQLQAMSTVGYLKRMGHTPVLLHWYPRDLERQYARRVPKVQIACHRKFTEENYPLSSLCRNEKQLIKEIEKHHLDMIITGSDALFRYVPKCYRTKHFSKRRLRFVNNYISCEDLDSNPFFCDYYGELSRQIPIVAFSVSSQSCPYYKMTRDECEKMGRYMRNFKKITVRDRWTKEMVETVSGIQGVQITPDPVFAFNQNCYIPIPDRLELEERYSLPERYALFSFAKGLIPSLYLQEIGERLRRQGIIPIALPEPEGFGDKIFLDRIELPLSPIDWYALMINAEAYIGTRMHPIIVCLHNSIPFFSFDGNGTIDVNGEYSQRSSKIYDILKVVGLEKHTYAIRSRNALPTVDNVLQLIRVFDRERGKLSAKQKFEEYMYQMSSIISLYTN